MFIHPFDHPDVVAGQGTVGLEIMEQCPEVRTIVVPVGGGGLASGIAVAASDAETPVRVVGVQAEAVAPLPASLAAGHPVRIEPGATMADGIAVAKPGEICCDVFGELGVAVVTVTEETLSQGLLLCLERAKQLRREPAGAARGSRHAGAPRGDRNTGRRGAVRRQYSSAAAGQGAATCACPRLGRYLDLRCQLPDRPGALATRCSGEVAALGANVLGTVHSSTHERVAPRCWWMGPRCSASGDARRRPLRCGHRGPAPGGLHAQIHLNAPRGRPGASGQFAWPAG